MKKLLSSGISVFGVFIPSLVFAQTNAVNSGSTAELISTLIYAGIGIGLCFLVYMLIDIMTPGHLAKQLAHEKNVALAIVVGAIMLGVSIIIAAAIH